MTDTQNAIEMTTWSGLCTPEMAAELLVHNKVNRSILKDRVKFYAKAMREGRWHLTGQAVIVSDEGMLIDGQHRLHACLASECSFPTVIIRGVPTAAMRHIDEGKPRSSGDVMEFEGIANGKKVAAIVNLIIGYEQRSLTSSSATRLHAHRDALIARYERDSEGIRTAVEVGERSQRAQKASPAMWGALWYLTSSLSSELAAEFVDGASSGIGLSEGDARLAFRNWIINRQVRGQTTQGRVLMLTGINAWNAWVSGRKVRNVRPYTSGQPHPVLIEP